MNRKTAPRKGRPKGTGGLAKELASAEIRRIDSCLSGTMHEQRNRALFYLGLGSGMRISEMCRLLINDVARVDSKEDFLVLGEVVLERHSTKSKKSRTVCLSKQAILYLGTYLKERFPFDFSEALFPSRAKKTKSLEPNSAIAVLSRMFETANVRHASSHSLRRTHANHLRRNGADLKIIQEQLGHSSLATTERYFSVDPIEKQRAIEALKF